MLGRRGYGMGFRRWGDSSCVGWMATPQARAGVFAADAGGTIEVAGGAAGLAAIAAIRPRYTREVALKIGLVVFVITIMALAAVRCWISRLRLCRWLYLKLRGRGDVT